VVWSSTSLVNLQDTGTPLEFSDNCALVPMAVQQGNNIYQLRIFVDSRLFLHPKHSAQSQAALFVHEAVYSLARQLGQNNSVNTRQAVGWLMQNSQLNSAEDILFKLDNLGFSTGIAGLKKVTPLGRITPISTFAMAVGSIIRNARDFWIDDNFRATENGRTEKEIFADIKTTLAREAIPAGVMASLTFNKSLAYLRKSTALPSALTLEAQAIVDAKASAIKAMLLQFTKNSTMADQLANYTNLDPAWINILVASTYKFMEQYIAPLASICITDEEQDEMIAANAASSYPFAFPVFTFDDLISEKSDDNVYFNSQYWLLEKLNRSSDIYDLPPGFMWPPQVNFLPL
jgi:hypothetical protein